MTTDLDPFEGAETIDDILFVVYDVLGPEGFQSFLEHIISVGELDRGHLIRAIDAFKVAGLSEAAGIMMDCAPKAPKELPLPARCPYRLDDKLHPIHRQHWMQTRYDGLGPVDIDYLRRNDPAMLEFLSLEPKRTSKAGQSP